MIISYCEGAVLDNVQRKQDEAEKMKQNLIELTKDITKRELTATTRITSEYQPHITMILPKWEEFKNA